MHYIRFFGTLILCVIFAASVHAQTPTTVDWSGFYAGGSLGLVKADEDTGARTAIGGANSYFTSPDDVQIAAAGDGSPSQSDLSGGLFAGFSKQYDNLLVGVEASANSLSVGDSWTQTVTYITAPANQFMLRQTVKADWQGTLRLRLGYTQDKWLAYVTGGAAWTKLKLKTSYTDDFVLGASSQGSTSETKSGWTLGAGGEYVLNKHWAVRGEYLYADFGRISVNSVVTNPSFPTLSNILTNSTDLRTQTFSVGLVYSF